MPHKSLELDAGASLFQLSLGLLGIFLLGLLEDGLRSAVDKSLGLGQAEVGDGADSLDDLDLLVADGGEDDVELILLFRCCACICACCRNYYACCCRYTKFFFTCFY